MIAIVAGLCRAKWLILIVFALVFSSVAAMVSVLPKKYESHMKLLVKNERADPQASETPILRSNVSEEEMNTELQLLTSTELLAAVVRRTGLESEFEPAHAHPVNVAVERATRKLAKELKITPVRKASIIAIEYSSKDRNRSAAVLSALAELYLDQHLRVHRSGGAYEFFKDQAAANKDQLLHTEANLNGFIQSNRLTLLPEQKELTLKRIMEIEQVRNDLAAGISETAKRIDLVGQQSTLVAPRIITQNRTSPNQYSVERLHTMLAELQNRKTQLDVKFRPDDRMVLEAEKEIADTRAALAGAEKIRSTEEATDVNPLRQSLDSELMKLRQTLAGLTSKKAILDQQLGEAKQTLARLESNSAQHTDLQRQLKESEDKYLLYAKKLEEAKISDSLDRQKISNVVLAERPIASNLPEPSRVNLTLGAALAVFVSFGAGFLSQLASRRLYTPTSVELLTELPVLATIPHRP